jgi:hypothetical protein
MKQLSGSILTLGIRSYSPNMCVGGRTLRHEALFQNASEHSPSTFFCKHFQTEDMFGSKVYQRTKILEKYNILAFRHKIP